MTLDQVMKLIDAGYTKEEINEFKDLQTSEEPDTAKEPKQKDKTDSKSKEPESKKPEPQHYPDEISKLTEQVKALTESMQEHFRNAAEEKKTGVSDGDSILKNILEKGEI